MGTLRTTTYRRYSASRVPGGSERSPNGVPSAAKTRPYAGPKRSSTVSTGTITGTARYRLPSGYCSPGGQAYSGPSGPSPRTNRRIHTAWVACAYGT